MYKNNKFIAIIPARGGSKGIPGKNIINIKGKPLIDYTIKEALASSYIDKVVVSTDSREIAEIAIRCGAEVPFLRPENLASDTSKTIDAILFTLTELKKLGQSYDYLVLLQPTQPLRKYFHINEAIETIIQMNGESLVSVSAVKDHPVLLRTITNKGEVVNLLNLNSTIRRQDFPEFFKVNGAIYINKIQCLNENTSFNDNLIAYKMDEKYDVDIDDYFDLEILKLKMNISDL